jgi:DNA-binding MarR family transcriptional regulator
LVAQSFIGPIPQGLEVNHLDGNKLNNHFENLEYTTRSGNTLHSFHVLGNELPFLYPGQGKDHHMARLTDDQVRKIRLLYKQNKYSQYQLSQRFGVSQSQISRIVNRKRWTHLD